MTKMPFQTPVYITDHHYLVAANRELICTIGDATPEEKGCIVTTINAHEDLVMALQGCLTIIDIFRRASGGDGDLTAAVARAALKKAGAL